MTARFLAGGAFAVAMLASVFVTPAAAHPYDQYIRGRVERAGQDRPGGVVGLHPVDQRGRDRSLQSRADWRDGDRAVAGGPQSTTAQNVIPGRGRSPRA